MGTFSQGIGESCSHVSNRKMVRHRDDEASWETLMHAGMHAVSTGESEESRHCWAKFRRAGMQAGGSGPDACQCCFWPTDVLVFLTVAVSLLCVAMFTVYNADFSQVMQRVFPTQVAHSRKVEKPRAMVCTQPVKPQLWTSPLRSGSYAKVLHPEDSLYRRTSGAESSALIREAILEHPSRNESQRIGHVCRQYNEDGKGYLPWNTPVVLTSADDHLTDELRTVAPSWTEPSGCETLGGVQRKRVWNSGFVSPVSSAVRIQMLCEDQKRHELNTWTLPVRSRGHGLAHSRSLRKAHSNSFSGSPGDG